MYAIRSYYGFFDRKNRRARAMLPTSSGELRQFQVERMTLARMSHAAIARIFDAGVDRHGQPYFVMEYVPGEPLNRFVTSYNFV